MSYNGDISEALRGDILAYECYTPKKAIAEAEVGNVGLSDLTPKPSSPAVASLTDEASKIPPVSAPVSYGTEIPRGLSAGAAGDLDILPDPMFTDPKEDTPDSSSMSDVVRDRGRSFRSQSVPRHRQPAARSTITSNVSTPTPPDNVDDPSRQQDQEPPLQQYATLPISYDYQPSYGQHTMPTVPPTSPEQSSLQSAYPAFHHSSGVPARITSPTAYTMMQPVLPSHSAVYRYQRHFPEGSSTDYAAYTDARASQMYGHQPAIISHSLHSESLAGQSNPGLTSFVRSNPFHSSSYAPAISTPPYAYPTQSFPASPSMYPSHYLSPAPYAQHFASPSEPDPQGPWWYFPHMPLPLQYEPGRASYQGQYVSYPVVGQHAMDRSLSADTSSLPSTPSTAFASRPHMSAPGSVTNLNTRIIRQPRAESGDPADRGRSSIGTSHPHFSRTLVRRPYHPNPQGDRSKWVMWVGNVPSDAPHSELWRFFNQLPDSSSDPSMPSGVLSIFLISRSSCAFVNFSSESQLLHAIEQFDGKPLRPNDPRCPRLLCRVRKPDDDLKSGVGGQRGMGIHGRWVKEQKGKQAESSSPSGTSPSESRLSTASSEQSAGSTSLVGERQTYPSSNQQSSHSGSYASTSSSFLSRYFPERYFILKSLTQSDLDISIENGLWATQSHNEGILDQAFRTSQDVFLVFSVNKSGEFYGYARMAGPVQHGEHRVSWAARADSASSHSSLSFSSPSKLPPYKAHASQSFASSSSIHESPEAITATDLPRRGSASSKQIFRDSPTSTSGQPATAPAAIGPHEKLPLHGLAPKYSLDPQLLRKAPEFALNESIPEIARQIRVSSHSPPEGAGTQEQSNQSKRPSLLQAVAEEGEKAEAHRNSQKEGTGAAEADDGGSWGESFRIDWLSTTRLPFTRTRHLRNPWNHDREVKVSRDGTELEPSVGKHLLEEWARLAEGPQTEKSSAGPSRRLAKSERQGKQPA